jgi:hypothetical protein
MYDSMMLWISNCKSRIETLIPVDTPLHTSRQHLCAPLVQRSMHLIKKTLSASWIAIASWPTQHLKLERSGWLHYNRQSISHLCPWLEDALLHSMSLQHPLTKTRQSWFRKLACFTYDYEVLVEEVMKSIPVLHFYKWFFQLSSIGLQE